MGRIVVTEFVSLDGVMQAPGGGEDGFERAGWTFEIDAGEAFGEYKLNETRNTAAMLLGRVTYDGFAASWPSVEGEFGDRFNALPKYVVSSTLQDPAWNNTTVLRGDLSAEVTALRERFDGDIVVHGSAQLAQHLLAHDLVDELRIMVFPVVLGMGKRLFADEAPKQRMHLTDTKVIGDGITLLVYDAR
jgi:dihydrofolate reductase